MKQHLNLFLFLLMIITACKKGEVKPFVADYRYQYTGDFEISVEASSLYIGVSSQPVYNNYSTVMHVSPGDSIFAALYPSPTYKPGIEFLFDSDGYKRKFIIAEDGILSQGYNVTYPNNKGGFIGMDSINFTYGSFHDQTTFSTKITGHRKKP